MRNPLNARHARELRNNLGKYLGLLFMMIFAVSFTSGFLMAASSIETIILGMDEQYRIEDGRFSFDFEPKAEALDAVRALGVTIYPDFYKEVDLSLEQVDGTQGITSRTYAIRDQVNLPAYAQGRAPEAADEVAFDRVFCENHGIELGDTVTLAGRTATVSGIMTLPDYQALFKNNNDFMFNALTFTVTQVSKEGYKALGSSGETFNYAFMFDDQNLTRAEKSDLEEDMIDALSDHDALLSDFVDAEDNQGIGYALDDVQGDSVMWTVLLLLLVVIMGFVFAILTGSTIEQESAVIGTLLASGWRKRELVAHYLLLPAIIGAIGASCGLAIGIFALRDPFSGLYYHSYSLPPYHTIWSWRVVFVTTVLPYLLLLGITLLGLLRSLRFTPLQFLRHEASGRRHGSKLVLPERLGYTARFRLRVIIRNTSHFVTLFFGIMFASLLLLFGICMLPVVENYAGLLRETVVAPHEYVLKAPVELEGSKEDIERYAALLRIYEDHDRIEANQDAIDALERLEDNDELVDALERLQDNQQLMDALDRLQNNTQLMDALKRLQDNKPLMDALTRLQENEALMDAIDRLQDQPELMDAAERLGSKQALVAAAERLQSKQELVAAAQRLQSKQALVAAAQRLQARPDVVAAGQRLANKQDIIAAAERLQARPDLMAAAQRMAAGAATEEDLALIASADTQTQADLQFIAALDEQTMADIALMASLDAQTLADLQTVSALDAQTQQDMQTVASIDAQTQRDMQTVSNMDAQTRADMELIANANQQTQDDLELISNLDEATRSDLELLTDAEGQVKDDLELLTDASGQVKDDLDLITKAEGQTKEDLELLMDLDDKTQADIDLIRELDDDLLDDLRLVSEIDEDAHVVNTQRNSQSALAAAEKLAMGSVQIERTFGGEMEDVTVYGIQPGSAYWTEIPVADGHAVAGRGLVEKTKVEVGSEATLENHREGKTYTLAVAEEASNRADTALYLTLHDFNELFGNDADYFNAYACAEELNIDGRYVANHIEPKDMDDISNQMKESMGNIMVMIMLMSVPIYLIIIYLLTKTVIDRSARSISYMKVFGYRTREVDGLYIRPITYFVLFSLVASIPLIISALTGLLVVVFTRFSGNFPIVIPTERLVLLVVLGMVAYAAVAALHVRRIKRVPLALALKVQE